MAAWEGGRRRVGSPKESGPEKGGSGRTPTLAAGGKRGVGWAGRRAEDEAAAVVESRQGGEGAAAGRPGTRHGRDEGKCGEEVTWQPAQWGIGAQRALLSEPALTGITTTRAVLSCVPTRPRPATGPTYQPQAAPSFSIGRPRSPGSTLRITCVASLHRPPSPHLLKARLPPYPPTFVLSYSQSQYYLPSPREESPYSSSPIVLHHPHPVAHHMQQQQPHHDQIPIDPALSMYSNSYYSYQQPPPMVPQHLMTASLSSPSSQGSEAMGTPPMEQYQLHGMNGNGKRPSSSMTDDSRKKSRKDDDADGPGASNDKEEVKTKPTRGSRACTVCRRLKMKCVGAEQGPPCKRCQTGNHECIFEESNRGKRSTKKHEILTRSLRKMERTLDTVLRSLGNPSIASGMISRSPSPANQAQGSHPLLATPSPPDSPVLPNSMHPSQAPGSPKLHSLPDNTLNPLGLLAEASLANRRAQAASRAESHATANTDDQPKLGVASDVYFKPGPMTILPLRRLFIERQIQPEMLSFVSTEEVVELFKIFFDNMNFQCNLLDPTFHTPSLVCSRSPFLLTTICAIASRFYTKRPELHAKLSDLARKLAFSVPAQGYKSVEIVQAYLLNTLWGCGPVERFEQDRTWMLLGMAIRMATDLNLHRRTAVTSPDTAEGRARDKEVRNRERTWIFCFCLDRSFSAQMGKPYTIKEDFIIRNASQWCRAPNAIPSDVALAAYADLQRILTRSLDLLYSGTTSPSGLQMDSDYLLVITTMETQILAWQHEWANRKLNESEHVNNFRRLASKFYFNYAMLIVNSFGLQNALERSAVDIGHFFARCHSSAVACAAVLRDEIGPQGYLRYSPDSTYVLASYAVLSLLKLLRPEFKIFLDHESKIIGFVNDIADVLEKAAVGPMHTPALYSCFLRALLSAKTEPPSGDSEGQPTHTPNGQAQASQDGQAANATAGGSHAHGNTGLSAMNALLDFNFDSEMGPVADMSTFPPTMAPHPSEDNLGMLTMDSILSASFWDSVLVPGYSNTMEGLSGGFVYGAGGSGLITPRLGLSPLPSGFNTPSHKLPTDLSQQKLDVAFNASAGTPASLHQPS